MHRKDYEQIAAAIRFTLDTSSTESKDHDRGAMQTLVVALIPALSYDNPRFDENRFREACGLL